MNKILHLLVLFMCLNAYSQNINIPDANFKAALIARGVDSNNDGEIQQSEALVPLSLTIANAGISDLTGIEFFTSLIILIVPGNNLTSIDISSNTALEQLTANSNPMTTLDVSGSSTLKRLYFADCTNLSSVILPTTTTNLTLITGRNNTSLTNIDVSPYPNLVLFRLTGGALTSLDVSSNPALQTLECINNNITSLDVSANPNLTTLSCQDNSIVTLDVSSSTSLSTLTCGNNSLLNLNVKNGNNSNLFLDTIGNPDLVCIQVDDATAATANTNFTKDSFTNYSDTNPCSPFINFPDANMKAAVLASSVDINNDGEIQFNEAMVPTSLVLANRSISDATGLEFFTSLTTLNVGTNNLSSLDISSLTSLVDLNCELNNLTSLDISFNTSLKDLRCSGNDFTSLGLSSNVTLELLHCSDMPTLTALNISSNTALKELECSNNGLTSLDVSTNSALEKLICRNNSLTSLVMSSSNSVLNFLNAENNNLTTIDLSPLSALNRFFVSRNDLTAIDMSSNTLLTGVLLDNNSLTQVNIANGNNSILNLFDVTSNPNLPCIQVDDAAAAAANTNFNKDATANYSENCGPFVTILNAPSSTSVPFTVDFSFDSDVTGFTASDVMLTNATISNFSATSGPDQYSALITPTSLCAIDITIDVPANSVLDVSNRPNSAAGQVVVATIDNVDPIALGQDITVKLGGRTGQSIITATDIDNGSSDNCGIASITVNKTTFDCTEIGPNTVTLTVTDTNGNISTTTAIVTVVDNDAPTVITQNITVQLGVNGQVTIVTADVDDGSWDNCGSTLSLSQSTFDCSNLGANTVSLTATDSSGNTDTTTAVVTVEDNQPLTTITQNITVELNAIGSVTISPQDVDNGSGSGCSNITLSLDQSTFTCADLGTNTITLTATEGPNTETATAIVTVEDTLGPNTIVEDVTINLDASNMASITVAEINNGTTDNCTATADITYSLDITSFSCSDLGANTVTLTATDGNGNSSTATAIVTVADVTAPTVITQNITVALNANGNTSISPEQIDNGSTDDCSDIASLSLDATDLICPSLGDFTITLTVTDSAGNTATETATVTITATDADNNGIADDCESKEIVTARGFSPNNDGINDTWTIENIDDFPTNKVSVFNQWGTKVFEAVDYGNDWDGTSTKGGGSKQLPVGAYLYIIETNDSEFPPKQGWIYINY